MPVILATQEVETVRITVQGQPRQKFVRPHFNQWLVIVVHFCHPSYMGKHKQEDGSPGLPEHTVRHYLKKKKKRMKSKGCQRERKKTKTNFTGELMKNGFVHTHNGIPRSHWKRLVPMSRISLVQENTRHRTQCIV
jgi:hypothetical protein